MRNFLPALLLCGITISVFNSCKTQSVPPAAVVTCNDPKPTYTADVKPILDANCAGTCHSAINHAANIDLSKYETVKAVSSNKKFLGSIRHDKGFEPMPRKNPKLSDDDIHKIACWVQGGSVL
jgi:hypothetical protein